MTDDEDQALLIDQAAAMVLPLLTPTPSPVTIRRPRCCQLEGYSLHADLQIDQADRKKLERLLRYGLRPPFAKKRLSLTPSGKVRLKLRKPYYTGQTPDRAAATWFLAPASGDDPSASDEQGAQILGHLNLPTTIPPFTSARAPPQTELDFCDDESVFDDVA